MNPQLIKSMDQCLRHLVTAISTASLYSKDHPQVRSFLARAHASLIDAIGSEQDLSLVRVDDQLAVDGRQLVASLYVDRFARMLKSRGIGHIKFLSGVTFDELQDFIGALARRDASIRSSAQLRLGQVEVRFRDPTGRFVLDDEAEKLLDDVSSEELTRIMEVYEAVSQKRKLHVVGLSEIVAEFVDVFSSYSDPLLSLVPLRSMDEYTFTHSLNVCMLNIAQASALGIDGPLLHDVGLSAMLHDVGKLFLPEEILNKPARLDNSEWEILKEHPVKGAEYLVQTPGVPRMAVVNAYEHHMRFDQRGYPTVGASWEQNLCSHMTAISDVFDSLRTKRPYRSPDAVEKVLDYMSSLGGTQLHPALLENFLRVMRRVHTNRNKESEQALCEAGPPESL